MGQACCVEDVTKGDVDVSNAVSSMDSVGAPQGKMATAPAKRMAEPQQDKAAYASSSSATLNPQQAKKDQGSVPATTSSQAGPAKGVAKFHELTVTITKDPTEESLGIDVDLTDDVALVIDKIKSGAVQNWNKANPSQALKENDRIVSVNGKRGSAMMMADSVKRNKVLVLAIERDSTQ
jgi:hypothetical protein